MVIHIRPFIGIFLQQIGNYIHFKIVDKYNFCIIVIFDAVSYTHLLSGCTKVLSNKGIDVTKNFIQGAEETLKIAKEHNAKTAILKAGSPSCGYKKIYDGSFLGNKIQGMGAVSYTHLDVYKRQL